MGKRFVKVLLITTFLISQFASCKKDNMSGDVEETFPAILTKNVAALNDNIGGVYVGLPYRYNFNLIKKSYPLIICFHGAAAYGNEPEKLDHVLDYGIPRLLALKQLPPSFKVNQTSFSFIVIGPQFKSQPSNEDVDMVVKYAKENYRIDTSRIYLLGTSVGGRMASNYAAEYTSNIAALLTMGGCADEDLDSKCQKIASGNLPVWAFHNRDDLAWPIGGQINFIATINSFTPTIAPLFTIFDVPEGEANHNCWRRATDPNYRENNMNIYEWMLQYHR